MDCGVRHDSVSDYRTRLLGGADGVQSFVRSQQDKWKWWKSDNELDHPWAAITLVTRRDSFEVARPDTGVNIRIRCWWNSVRQALKEPFIELQSLRIDQVEVKPEYILKKDKNGSIADSYYLYSLPHPAHGKHAIEAMFKNLRNNTIRKMDREFFYENSSVR